MAIFRTHKGVASISLENTGLYDKYAWPHGVRPLSDWDCGFESRRERGCLSPVSVVCCQVEVSATSRSLVQRSPTDCGVSECDR